MKLQAHQRTTQEDYEILKNYLESFENSRQSKVASLLLCWLINRFNSSNKQLSFDDKTLSKMFLPLKSVKRQSYKPQTIKFARCLLVKTKLIQTVYIRKRDKCFNNFNRNYYFLNENLIEELLGRKVLLRKQELICEFDGLRKTKREIKLNKEDK